MAKKKIAQEACLFCHEFPCKCDVIPARKLLREQNQELKPDDVLENAEGDDGGNGTDPDLPPTGGGEAVPPDIADA